MADRRSQPDCRAQVQAAVDCARALVAERTARLAELNRELATLLNEHPSDAPPVVEKTAERDIAKRALDDAIRAEGAAYHFWHSSTSAWLPGDALNEVANLSARHPVVLLPVRIETHFARKPPAVARRWQPHLMVRVYPDELEIDTHDLSMTDAEWAAAERYWKTAERAGEQEAWREIVMTYPSTRAAWLVRRTAPPSVEDDKDFNFFLPPRTTSWSRPALTYVMPDRWHFLGYRGGTRVAHVIGNAIPPFLMLSPDPSLDPDDPTAVEDVSGHGLVLDRALRWTVDFEEAVRVGMAARIPLSGDDAVRGFDQLFVIGVKSSQSPFESAASLANLFDSHHYTGGFAFLPQGTPAHNTSELQSPFPAPDPGGEHSFPIERGAPKGEPLADGTFFQQALGIRPNVIDHIENADQREQLHERAFRRAIWPGTLGYFIRQMWDPLSRGAEAPSLDTGRFAFTATVDWQVHAHFIDYVRGGAALPPFRAGSKLYGLIPVTSLQRFHSNATQFDRLLPPMLRSLMNLASSNLATIPRIGRSGDDEADLLTALGMDARSRRVRVRPMLGPLAQSNLLNLLGISPESWAQLLERIRASAMGAIGHPDWDALITGMSFGDAGLFANELVARRPSESAPLDPNYIQWLRTATVDELRRETLASRPAALLYHVLRYAVLNEYDRLASLLQLSFPGEPFAMRPDIELPGFSGEGNDSTAWTRLGALMPDGRTYADYLVDPSSNGDPGARFYRESLEAIETLSTAELERLFTTALDTCSHRFEAWITSLATKRLSSMRTTTPEGSHLGGYGWVENVRPRAGRETQTLPDGRIALVQENADGYVHNAAMTHAAAASVLRNTAGGGEHVKLASDRAGKALRILEDVRSGETLGSALGHRFERGLRGASAIARLQETIDSFRLRYPLVANKIVDSHQPANLIAARNVVDGHALLRAYRDGTLALDEQVLPPASNERLAVDGVLAEIADTVAAISDLLTTESVFQSMRGNPAAAAGSLEAFAHGTPPPEIECVRQPRSGTSLTHRFAIVLGGTDVEALLWTAPSSPRSRAEPHLDAWIGNLLGDPNTIRCRVKVPNPSIPGDFEIAVSLAELDLRPIDFLALAAQSGDSGGETPELEQRLINHVGGIAGIDHAPWPDRSIRSFAEAMEVARAIQNLLAVSRPLRPEDLVLPAHREAAKLQPADTGGRAAAARAELQIIQGQLEAFELTGNPALAVALDAAAQFGIRGAYYLRPPLLLPLPLDELKERARTVRKEVERRLLATSRRGSDEEVLDALFGPDFVVLPEFDPYRPAELSRALAYAPTLVGDARAAEKWLHQASVVRGPLGRFRTLMMYASASGALRPGLDVAQLPFVPGASWVALPFEDEEQRPPSGRLSIVLHRAVAPPVATKWAGLFVDEWSEVIPAASEQTAISFSHDSPRAEAPQAVLVAVPPVEGERWDFDSLADCVRETLQLAKVRGADLETLGAIGQLVPALCLASNAAGNAVSAGLSSMLAIEPGKGLSQA